MNKRNQLFYATNIIIIIFIGKVRLFPICQSNKSVFVRFLVFKKSAMFFVYIGAWHEALDCNLYCACSNKADAWRVVLIWCTLKADQCTFYFYCGTIKFPVFINDKIDGQHRWHRKELVRWYRISFKLGLVGHEIRYLWLHR